MNTTNFRALCAELVDWVERASDLHRYGTQDLITRARTALAVPEPEKLTDEELIQLAIDTRLYRFQATIGDPVQYEMTEQQVYAFARAVLARWGR
jgi:hypothetical protein